MKLIILDLRATSDELILAGKLQLKKLQKKKPEKKNSGFRQNLVCCLQYVLLFSIIIFFSMEAVWPSGGPGRHPRCRPRYCYL